MYKEWQEEYKRKLMPAEEAVKLVKSGEHVHIPVSTQDPALLEQKLFERKDELKNVHIETCAPVDVVGWFFPGAEESFSVDIFNHCGTPGRPGVRERYIKYTPVQQHLLHKIFDPGMGRPKEDIRPVDVLLIKVRSPNEHGFCNLGANLWSKQTYIRTAKKIIVEVDDNLQNCFGDTWIHVSKIDAFTENTLPFMSDDEMEQLIAQVDPSEREARADIIRLVEPARRSEFVPKIMAIPMEVLPIVPKALGLREPTEEIKAISGHLSTLIKDGDCIGIGTGTPSADMVRTGTFDDKHDISYHSEMAARGVAKLWQRGIMTGKYNTLHPGIAMAGGWAGCDAEDMDIINNNPRFQLRDQSYTIDPATIARIDNYKAMQNALSVDLTGQVNSETVLGGLIVNGPGGQPEMHLGAVMSKGGTGIHLMPSTAVGGGVSRIVPRIAEGDMVTIPRFWADVVVTEYGIARLLGKSQRQRADELIAIAHPDFRAELRKEAKKLFYP